jgi:GNAT superfamily N-acetyltransferase
VAAENVLSFRELERDELARVAEIDRSERIDAIYVQHGTELEVREGDFSSPSWTRDGTSEHSVAGIRALLEGWFDAGAVAVGAFLAERLVGIGLVVPHFRPRIAQLAFLYVTAASRRSGIGVALTTRLEDVARERGAARMVVSATPSRNTVDFYVARGFAPTASPLPELVELEPDDVHLEKAL